ncbi:TPA: tetraspanin 16 [Bos taurus]|uniref:Tetraspanin 16 n=1 Tax=Bos taurus TaxID=9913 RepID=Q32LA5_BOVIN|nr:tetraspanin-16 [Bos taurus]AAI09677.1 Tetraspanin 16 [Bos taurus]DAA27936.1 TPA: tetraspanin 16 [Bos taurus]
MAERHIPYYSLKKLFSFFNGVTVLSGMILIGLSIYVNFRGAVLTKVLGRSSAYLFHVGYLCLVMGSVTVLLGFARWHGAAKESRGTLLFCFLVMVIILIVQITAATVVLAFFPVRRPLAGGGARKEADGKSPSPPRPRVPKKPPQMGSWLFSVLTAPRFIAEVREVALEHNFVTLRKNYRGYKEPDDYSMRWNLVMEKLSAVE